MKTTRFIAFVLSMIMTISVLVPSLFVSAETGEDDTFVSMGDMSVTATNSFGSMLAEELTAAQREQLQGNGNTVFSIEMTDNTAVVSFQTITYCTLVVGIYDESGQTMIASGRAEVSPEDSEARVEIMTDQMPQYYYVRGYLMDSYTLAPLSLVYDCPNYTQEMQEFFSKTVDDFDTDRVLNLDDDPTNNFAVYKEGTIILEPEAGYDKVVTADDENNLYVIENADDTVLSLQEGDVLSYEYAENEMLIVKVGSVAIDENTVIIHGAETNYEEIFGFIHIDSEASNSTNPVNYRPRIQQYKPIDASVGIETLKYTKHFTEMESTNQFLKYSVNGDFSIEIKPVIKIYVSKKVKYIEAKLEFEVQIEIEFGGSVSFQFNPLNILGDKTIKGKGLEIDFSPKIELKLSGKVVASGKITGAVGFRYELGKGGEEIKEIKPEIVLDAEVVFFIGINFNPSIKILNGSVVDIEMKGRLGIEFTGKLEYSTNKVFHNTDSSYHSCVSCIDGDVNIVAGLELKARFLGDLFDEYSNKPIDIKIKIGDFYYSFDHLNGGWDECPYKYYRIDLIVQNEQKEPLANVCLQFPDGEKAKASLNGITLTDVSEIYTDSSGKASFFINNNASGHLMHMTKEKYEPTDYPLILVTFLGKKALVNGQPADNVVLTIPYAKQTVTVNVTDENGNPMDNARVTCGDDALYTDENGQAVFRETGKHGFRLTVNAKDYRQYMESFVLEQEDVVKNVQLEKIIIVPPDSPAPSDPDAKYVRFIVKDENGKPIEFATVSVVDDSTLAGVILHRTDENGIADFTLEEGTHSVRVYYERMTASQPKYGEQEFEFTYSGGVQIIDVVLNGSAGSIVASGECGAEGGNVTWQLNDQGTLTISGSGKMKGYSNYSLFFSFSPFYQNANISTVIISNGVTSIGGGAFSGCTGLTNITIPDSVTSIGGSAFSDCTELTSITIPDSIISIGNSAFSGCTGLTSIAIPDSVTAIEDDVFWGCSNLTFVTIPDSVTSIGEETFYDCETLTSIVIPNSVTSIGAYAFSGCSSLSSVSISEATSFIGAKAFEQTQWLSTMRDNNPLVVINGILIDGSTAEGDILLESNIISIADQAFRHDDSFRHIVVVDKPIVNRESVPNEILTSISIPESVTTIGKGAFYACYNLKTVILPSKITCIDAGTFSACKNLTSLSLPDSITTICENAFSGSGLGTLSIPDNVNKIGNGAFSDCYDLESISLSNNAQLGSEVFFNCRNLKEVNIPIVNNHLANGLFCGCKALSTITIPDSIKSIWKSAFLDCDSLTDIYFTGTKEQWESMEIGDYNNAIYYATIHIENDEPVSPKPHIVHPDTNVETYEAETNRSYNAPFNTEAKPLANTESNQEDVPNLSRNIALTELSPSTVYNYYVLHSDQAEDRLHPANILYLTQFVSAADGTASLSYTLPFADEDAVTLAVPMEKTVNGASVSIPDVTYTGRTVSPSVTVSANGTTLIEGIDYELSGNLTAADIGTYLITITGIGDYTGEITTGYSVVCEHDIAGGVCRICGTIKDETLLYGDITLDSRISIADAVLLARILAEVDIPQLESGSIDRADADQDGLLTILDLRALMTLLTLVTNPEQTPIPGTITTPMTTTTATSTTTTNTSITTTCTTTTPATQSTMIPDEDYSNVLPGDVDLSEYISLIDAFTVLKNVTEVALGHQSSLTRQQQIAADVNCDGAVNVIDANLILRYYFNNHVIYKDTDWSDLQPGITPPYTGPETYSSYQPYTDGTSFPYEYGPQLYIGSEKGIPISADGNGEKVNVPVMLENAGILGALSFVVEYDERLTLIENDHEGMIPVGIHLSTSTTSSDSEKHTVAFAGITEKTKSKQITDTLLNLQFLLPDDAESSTVYPIKIVFTEYDTACDGENYTVPILVTNGSICVS